MCGLCGEIRFDEGQASASALEKMTDAMKARGPDSGGVFVNNSAGIGHRRLSILDLSLTSQQPMIDSELGLSIAFNGCIYNFRELRRELQAKGYRFFSDGDTEVILKAYHAWGARCAEHFHGMFAYAILERNSGRTVLTRDRLGIKPLYYSEQGKTLRFASSLPALLAAGGVDTEIDAVALHHYMSFHAVVPAPMTVLKGVRKLAPATIMTIEPNGKRRTETYWKLDSKPQDRVLSEGEWREAVQDAMRTSIRRRRVADVPVGVLLSGGLDSSLVTALLAESGQKDLKTFSIGFESVRDIEGDEFRYSDLVAREYGTDHHRIQIDASRTLSSMPGAIEAMSEPMMSHDAIGFYLLSEEVSRHIKVVLSGQGADEIFGGYHWYPNMMRTNDATSEYARIYFDRDHEEMKRTLSPRLLGSDHSRDFVEQHFDNQGEMHPVDKALRIDTEIMLVDDPVKRVDNMTMAWGLEARVPFLDHELVELASRMPAGLKVRDGGKYILKEASRGIVPDAIIDRPKGYFPVPALKYLQGPYLDFVRDTLNAPEARKRDLFQRDYIDRMLAEPENSLTPKGHSKLWQAALLESWFQTHGI
jgi:asparagine synthase (glutamine-hydrolysing)